MRIRSRSPRPHRRSTRRLLAGALAATVALVGGLIAAVPATAAIAGGSGTVKTAAVVGFNAENIISDALFYDGNAMSAAQIQTFLDAKIGSCANGRCLNVLTITADSRSAYYSQTTGNLVCADLTGGTMRASEYIYRVQVACGISAKVILVTMQKEQGLVTDNAPTETELRRAMGHLCSDTAPCETAAAGIGNQIFGGTEQLKKYKATAFGKQPGRNWVGYNPAASCGGTYLNIQNYATAALYSYTPYQPNAAALAAGSGLGDGCSSYGNRNFFTFYTSWFGSTQATVDPCKAPDASATTPAAGYFTTTAATGLNGRAAPTTECSNVLAQFPQGTKVERISTFNGWSFIRVAGTSYWVSSDYLAAAASPYTADRIGGVSRYSTAVKVSQRAYPNGAGTVMIASGTDFPDALAAGAAAGSSGAALLLTEPGQLLPEVTNEILRLKATKVVLLGGADRVSPTVEQAIAAAVPSATVTRIAGVDRYETSRLIAAAYFPKATSAYVVTGTGFADAVVAAALGGATKSPVILVDGAATSADRPTIDRLKQSGVTSITIAGSAATVSAGIESTLANEGFKVTRQGGVNRYETSRLLNAAVYPQGAKNALLATGTGFPDALTGSVLAAQLGAPLFTTPQECFYPSPKDWVIAGGVTSVILLGDTPSLSDAVFAGTRC